MSIIPIENENQWHDLRSQHIGGSEIGIIFGASTYSTLNELYHNKRGTFERNLDNKLMQWGRAFEPVIATLISGDNHWGLKHCEEYHEHPDHPFLGATLDYHVVESEHGPGLLEIKNVQQFAPNWSKKKAPAHVELQIQHQFLVVNAARASAGLKPYTWGAIGSLHAGNPEDVRIMYRKPDAKIHAHIIEQAGKFWDDVQSGNEPDIISHRDLDHISTMYRDAEPLAPGTNQPDLIVKPGDAVLDEYMHQYQLAKEAEKEARNTVGNYKAKILRHLMAIDDDGNTKQVAARTDNYSVETKIVEVHRKASPAKVTQSMRFTVRGLGE